MPGITNGYDVLFKKFRLGLQNWCRTGKEPSAADQDMRYYLDLQEKRLKDHDLKLDIKMESDDEITEVHRYSVNIPIIGSELAKFDKSLYCQYVNREESYTRDGKILYKKADHPVMYQTILSPEPGEKGIGKTKYVCPNCGAVSTIEELESSGCAYCGTRYLMKDLYPKVSNYYFIENGFISDEQWKRDKRRMIMIAALGSLIQIIHTLFTDPEFTFLLAIPSFFLGFALWGFVTYLVYSGYKLVTTIKSTAKSAVLTGATAGAKNKITDRLRVYDPSFDYEYFEGKALSFARILMLGEHPEEFVQYRGKPIGGTFKDIVDVQYRGRMGVKDIRKSGGRIEAELELYLTDTLDSGGKIRHKDEKISISMYHNAEFPVDKSFSILKVECQNCGGSFDAARKKCCPYCGSTYDAGRKDWIVTDIHR